VKCHNFRRRRREIWRPNLGGWPRGYVCIVKPPWDRWGPAAGQPRFWVQPSVAERSRRSEWVYNWPRGGTRHSWLALVRRRIPPAGLCCLRAPLSRTRQWVVRARQWFAQLSCAGRHPLTPRVPCRRVWSNPHEPAQPAHQRIVPQTSRRYVCPERIRYQVEPASSFHRDFVGRSSCGRSCAAMLIADPTGYRWAFVSSRFVS
jgi:hypothetical protein